MNNDMIIDPIDLKKLLGDQSDFYLLDVRQPEEYVERHIPGCTLIPLGDLPKRIDEIPFEKDIVIYCAHGIRSMNAALFLNSKGAKSVRSLKGGLAAFYGIA